MNKDDSIARTAVTHMWSHSPEPYKVTAEHAADWIMSGDANQQAALFVQMMAKTHEWGPHQAWPIQCRSIAECMTSEDCYHVRQWLASLMEHLEAIPAERRAKEMTDQICDGIKEVLA
jgi:hypothetical protein